MNVDSQYDFSKPSPVEREADHRSAPLSILLADDDHISRLMMKKALNKEGYRVTTAENGYQALKIFTQKPFPIIITDWMMPEMDGLELCRAIRSMSLESYVYIMILTLNDPKEDIALGLEAGADDYLNKPFHPLELFAKLKAGQRIITLEHKLRENNSNLKNHIQFIESLINTIPHPVFFKNKQGVYLGCNKICQDVLLGLPAEAIIGRELPKKKDAHLAAVLKAFDAQDKELLNDPGMRRYEARILCTDGIQRDFLFNKGTFQDISGGVAGLVGVLQDLSEKKEIVRKQTMNIQLARGILQHVNGEFPRQTAMADGRKLVFEKLSIPCFAEGGDHFFIRTMMSSGEGRDAKTVISLKDQSGHEVGCILRSIITDLLHHQILDRNPETGLPQSLDQLNQALCQSGLFCADDFVTSISAEIDHRNLRLRYVSAGHPSFLLISGKRIFSLPDSADAQGPPLGVLKNIHYSAGEYALKEGDIILFYTDGLIEMPVRNRGEMISYEELHKIIKNILKRKSMNGMTSICRGLLNAVAKRSRESVSVTEGANEAKNTSRDDITIVGIQVKK